MGHHLKLGLALAVLVAACGTTTGAQPNGAEGFASPPAGVDARSPLISAMNLAFDRTEVNAPVGTPFILVFENREKLPHNVSIYRDAAYKDRVFEGVVFDGPGTRWYPVPALALGTYFFQCDVHPIEMMQGTITAGL